MLEKLKVRWASYRQMRQSLRKRFMLDSEVYLVRGAKRGAIYDLNTGRVYSLSGVASQALDLLVHQGMRPLEAACELATGSHELVTILDSLAELKLGHWYEGGFRPSSQYTDVHCPPQGLRGLCIELTSRCNLRCIHCYAESGPEASIGGLHAAEWRRLIANAAVLGCRIIMFGGGEPLLAKELLLELIAYARDNGLQTGVFTNCTLLSEEVLDSLSKFAVLVGSSIYGPNEEVHDEVTCAPGSFKAMTKNVLRLRARDIPVRMNMPVMLENQDYIEETEEFVRARLNADFKVAPVALPVGRGCLNALVSSSDAFLRAASTKLFQAKADGKVLDIPARNKPDFLPVRRDDFARQLHNACWSGDLHILSNGDVIPCAAARTLVLANVKHSKLETIIVSGALQRLWKLTKDQVHICQTCEYRYACRDCLVRVLAEVGSLYEKPAWCSYDPQVGEWQRAPASSVKGEPRQALSSPIRATNQEGSFDE